MFKGGQSRSRDFRSSNDRDGDNRSYGNYERHEEDAEGYVSYSEKVKRLTFEEIDCDDVTIDNLDEKSKAMLDKGGITELFPV